MGMVPIARTELQDLTDNCLEALELDLDNLVGDELRSEYVGDRLPDNDKAEVMDEDRSRSVVSIWRAGAEAGPRVGVTAAESQSWPAMVVVVVIVVLLVDAPVAGSMVVPG